MRMERAVLTIAAVLLMAAGAHADLRAWWAFDEGTGDMASDSSMYGNTGLLIADTEAGDPASPLPGSTLPDWISGVNGGALQFCAGTDNYNHVDVAKSDSLKDLGAMWTFSMWVRQDSRDTTPGGGGGYPRVISTPNYEIELGVPSWEYDYFWPYGTGSAQTDIGTSYIGAGGQLGDWYLMTLTYDGTDLKKYFNGTLVPDSVKNIPDLLLTNIWDDSGWDASPLKIASQVWPNKDWFIGALDDVAIWGDGYLDADAVMGLAQGQYTPATAPLSVPEPISLVLLGAGAVLLRRKRA